MFTLTFDPPVDAATQVYAEQLVSDYLRARQEAVNLETLRNASEKVQAEVQTILDAEKVTQETVKAEAARRAVAARAESADTPVVEAKEP